MASRHYKKATFELEFEHILEYFTKEILRDEPKELIDFGCDFFHQLEQGKKWVSKDGKNVIKKKTMKIQSFIKPRIVPFPRLMTNLISSKGENNSETMESNYTEKQLVNNMIYEFNEEQYDKDETEIITEEKSEKDFSHETMLQLIFQQIDVDNSGFIDFKELENFLILFAKETGQSVPGPEQVKQLMNILDENQDGKISFEEIKCILGEIIKILENTYGPEYQIFLFESMLQDEERFQKVLENIFQKFDVDKSGFISSKELYNMITELSANFQAETPTKQEIDDIIAQFDDNKDGQLSFEEIKSLLIMIIQALLQKIKRDVQMQNGEYTYQDILDNPELLEKSCNEMFEFADTGEKGYILIEEFFKFAKSIAEEFELEEPSLEQSKEIFTKLDVNGNERLTLEEMTPYLKEIVQMRAIQDVEEEYQFESYQKLLENWELTQNLLMQVFQKFDKEQNGQAEIEAFEAMTFEVFENLKLPNDDQQEFFGFLLENIEQKSGMFSLEDFEVKMHELLESTVQAKIDEEIDEETNDEM